MKSVRTLHLRALEAVKYFQKSESSLLKIIQEVDAAKVFLEMGYSSLFVYLTESLKLNEGQAYAYSTVSRKSREVPALQVAVENGLSLYKAQRISAVINKTNQEEWISKAKELPKAKLEMEVAALSPSPVKKESIRAVGDYRISVKVEISDRLNEKLKRVRTLVSNRKKKNSTLEDCLEELLDFYLEKKDPIKKAERVLEKRPKRRNGLEAKSESVSISPCPGRVVRRNIPVATKHQVLLRDQGRCNFKGSSGRICASERRLEVHHLKPWAIGGTHQLENLQSLCRAHHNFRHG